MIVVTGAAGFIGRNLLERLTMESHEEILTVDFEGCHLDPFEFLNQFANGDLQITTIFHNGACSSTTAADPNYVMTRNFDYTMQLQKLCIQFGTRLIYASSASVYGDGPFNEEAQTKPKNLYAISKSIFDLYGFAFRKQCKQLVGLRYFNVYGKFEENKGSMSSVVYKFFKQSESGDDIKLFEGSDRFFRDFIHIDDVVEANLFFYNNPQFSGIYNVGTGVERSFLDIANIFKQKYKIGIETIEVPQELVGKYQRYTKSDNHKISKIFKYKYKTLEQGVNKYLSYLEKQ
jgi:ADP-L-glycero-D-manno-heptose 6-epimerase